MASPRDKITLRRIAESSWVRPFAFLILIIVLWDLTVRLFKIPAYLIPAPKDVIIAFWTEGDKLLAEAVPTTTAALPSRPCSASRWRC
jgi:NitT/TauT family transport system permease protein